MQNNSTVIFIATMKKVRFVNLLSTFSILLLLMNFHSLHRHEISVAVGNDSPQEDQIVGQIRLSSKGSFIR